MIVLTGDIGGTNTRLALAEIESGQARLLQVERYQNDSAASLDTILNAFLAASHRPEAACLAVAGPTDGCRVRFTNLDWEVDSRHLSRLTGIAAVSLINDFVAVGHGLSALGSGDYVTLQAGEPVEAAPRVALGAGTGLGVVQCAWTGTRHLPLPSEGGHIAFAPADPRQAALLIFLQHELGGRVSLERILSGPGLAALYRFCWREAGLPGAAPPLLPAEVSAAALSHSDGIAVQAVRLFARILGQAAGDFALIAQGRGGVYLAGGIAPQILPFLQTADFLEGLSDKGRFSDWMESVPVHVVTDVDVGLKGAALAACQDCPRP